MKPSRKASTEPPVPCPPEEVEALINRLLAVSEQILTLARQDLQTQAQPLQQLLLERGTLLDNTRHLALENLPDDFKETLAPRLERLTQVDQELGEVLQTLMSHIQLQLGTCKNSRHVVSHYRSAPPAGQHTHNRQA